jgi:hypothetical protein
MGVGFGPDGNFYVASAGTGQILRYNGTTGAFLGAFVTAGSGGLATPQFFVFRQEIPEPSTWSSAALGLVALAWKRRRRC